MGLYTDVKINKNTRVHQTLHVQLVRMCSDIHDVNESQERRKIHKNIMDVVIVDENKHNMASQDNDVIITYSMTSIIMTS